MKLSTRNILDRLNLNTDNQLFYKKLSDKEAQIIRNELLDCLYAFDRICRENGLTYLILAGGLIGIIRDGNLLPWDDDLDLVMPRDDYKKFQKIFSKSEYAQKYVFKYPQDNHIITMGAHFYNPEHSLAKLISGDIGNSRIYEDYAYLDIIPLDSCSNNRLLDKKKGTMVNIVQMGYVSRAYFRKNNPFVSYLSKQSFELKLNLWIRRIYAFLFLIIPKKALFKLLDKLLIYSSDSVYVTASYGALRYFGEKMPRNVFFPVKDVMLNGIKAMIPHDAHKYLEHRYGNYMEIPSKEKIDMQMMRLKKDWEKYISKKK